MAIIGKFKKLGDGYTGTIQTLLFSTPAALEPVEKKSSKKAPDFKLTIPGVREIGAAWEKTSHDDQEYLSIEIDDASLAAPIYCALFESEDGDDFVLIWSRDRRG